MDLLVLFESILISVLPFYAAMLFLLKAGELKSRSYALYPFAAGMLIFFLIDSFKDAASLGGDTRVAEGFLIFIPFILLFIAMTGLAGVRNSYFLPAVLVLAIAVHTSGETAEIVELLGSVSISRLFSDYIASIIGFAGHKLLEGFVVALILSESNYNIKGRLILFLTIPLAVSTIGGIASMIYISSVYFFAAGAAGDIFALAYIFSKRIEYLKAENRYVYFYLLAGFVLIYFLGYLHSIA